MPVGFDSAMLSLLLNQDSRVPDDPKTGQPTDCARERVQALIVRLQKERQRVIIPAPSAAEVLTVLGPTSAEYLQVINKSRVFEVRAFDEIAAIELAFLNRDAFGAQDKKNGLVPYQKLKVDRQILAVCRVARCEVFYTDDKSLIGLAALCGMPTMRVSDLPIPDEARQHVLALDQHEELPELEAEDVDASADTEERG